MKVRLCRDEVSVTLLARNRLHAAQQRNADLFDQGNEGQAESGETARGQEHTAVDRGWDERNELDATVDHVKAGDRQQHRVAADRHTAGMVACAHTGAI